MYWHGHHIFNPPPDPCAATTVKRRGKTATADGTIARRPVVHKVAALPLFRASLRALVNNIGNGIRRARFLTPFGGTPGVGLKQRRNVSLNKRCHSRAHRVRHCSNRKAPLASNNNLFIQLSKASPRHPDTHFGGFQLSNRFGGTPCISHGPDSGFFPVGPSWHKADFLHTESLGFDLKDVDDLLGNKEPHSFLKYLGQPPSM